MSQITRRQFQSMGAALFGFPAMVRAQGRYPSRPVRLVVPFAPGGGTDTLGRAIAQKLPSMPDLPTLPEAGLLGDAFELVGWLALAAPAKTPMEIQELLAAEIRKAFTDPAMKARIEGMGYGMVPDSSP